MYTILEKCYSLYATSGNTRSMPHKEIQDVRHIRKCYVCLKNNIYATSGNTIYCTPHQEIRKVRHIRKCRMYAISGNAKNNVYATSGNTIYCTPYQEIQEVRHIRKHNVSVCHISKTWHPFDVAYQILVRHIRKFGTPHQWIRRIRFRESVCVCLCVCDWENLLDVALKSKGDNGRMTS